MTPMRDAQLLLVIHLGEGPSIRRVEKDRVVSETVRPARLRRDFALDRAGGLEHHISATDGRKRADESCSPGPAWLRGQTLVDRIEALGVSRVRPKKTGGADTRLPVEGIDDESRVLGDGEQRRVVEGKGRCRVVQHLEAGVFSEGRSGLVGLLDSRQIRERQYLNGRARQHCVDLAQLVAIGGRD